MTYFADLKAQIAEYANREDWSDLLVTGFVRQAEQKFNAELRVDRMIQTDQSTIVGRCAMLPDDWLEMDFVSTANAGAPNGWKPIRYMAREQFFRSPDKWTCNFYTIEGREITFGGAPDATEGNDYKISYYGEVPVFSDEIPSWIYTKYPSLYLSAAMMNAFLHAVGEEDKAAGAKQLTEDTIQKLNADHLRSKASGSRVTRTRMRSFG
jgi:hypothetical protein